MKTTVIGSDKAKNNNEVKTTNRPSLTGKEAQNENNKSDADKAPAQTPQVEATKATEAKANIAPAMDKTADLAEAPKAEQLKEAGEAKPQEQPKAEPTKIELKEQFKAKPIFNLDATVKLVNDLGKKITQRDRLRATIDNLDTFTIAPNEEDDVTGSNKFHRCELTIADDDGNEFVTKNAYIIEHVTQYVNSLCVDKLAEIEAEIVIPV